MIGPMQEEAAVIAAENSGVYPSSFMAGIRMEPIAAVSATAAPVIPAKNIEEQNNQGRNAHGKSNRDP